MKVWYFVLYNLYLLSGCFTLASIVESQAILFVLGGAWGFIVGRDAISRWFD